MDNYYAILGVSPDASSEQIRQTCLDKRFEMYSLSEEAFGQQTTRDQQIEALNQAERILCNPDTRKSFDEELYTQCELEFQAGNREAFKILPEKKLIQFIANGEDNRWDLVAPDLRELIPDRSDYGEDFFEGLFENISESKRLYVAENLSKIREKNEDAKFSESLLITIFSRFDGTAMHHFLIDECSPNIDDEDLADLYENLAENGEPEVQMKLLRELAALPSSYENIRWSTLERLAQHGKSEVTDEQGTLTIQARVLLSIEELLPEGEEFRQGVLSELAKYSPVELQAELPRAIERLLQSEECRRKVLCELARYSPVELQEQLPEAIERLLQNPANRCSVFSMLITHSSDERKLTFFQQAKSQLSADDPQNNLALTQFFFGHYRNGSSLLKEEVRAKEPALVSLFDQMESTLIQRRMRQREREHRAVQQRGGIGKSRR